MSEITAVNKIVWLASYPKSGNTWFRAFISALLNDGTVEINSMKTDGIFSAREIFDNALDIDSRYLYDGEIKTMAADVFRQYARLRNKLSFVKVHDAYESDIEGDPIIPTDATHCALYFIRNPLDVAGSLANHLNVTMERAVAFMNDPNASFAPQKNNFNINPQLRQHLSSWAGHVKSWTAAMPFPVMVMRYEDMLENTFDSFARALKFVGWQYSEEQVRTAMQACSFDRLSSQEAEKGFQEKYRKSPVFFRQGKMDNWKKELTPEQVNNIVEGNKEVMLPYDYWQES